MLRRKVLVLLAAARHQVLQPLLDAPQIGGRSPLVARLGVPIGCAWRRLVAGCFGFSGSAFGTSLLASAEQH